MDPEGTFYRFGLPASNLAGNRKKEIDAIFKKYPDDYSLQNVQKQFAEYSKKATKARLDAMNKKIDTIIGTRKFEASGGTRLWFGDRRKTRGSQMTR